LLSGTGGDQHLAGGKDLKVTIRRNF